MNLEYLEGFVFSNLGKNNNDPIKLRRTIKVFLVDKTSQELEEYKNHIPIQHWNMIQDFQPKPVKEKITNLISFANSINELPALAVGLKDADLISWLKIQGVEHFDSLPDILDYHSILYKSINLSDWFSDILLNSTSNFIFIEDPFFFSKFNNSELIIKTFNNLKNKSIKILKIKHKKFNVKRNNDKPFTYAEIKIFQNLFRDEISKINPDTKVSFDDKDNFHDRCIITNTYAYLIGNSFNIKDNFTTYSAGYPIVKYLIS